MIKLLKDFPEILLEIIQVDDHAGYRINLPLKRDFNDIIVAMCIFIVAGTKNLFIFGIIPFGIVVPM